MLIDWFTVGAQAANFLVLVWLLRRFLYRPILRAIDAREERIVARLADADAKEAAAGEQRDEFQRKNAELDGQREALLAKATAEAKVERERLLAEAKQAADTLATGRRDALDSEGRALRQALGRRTQREVFEIARRALADLASSSLEEQVGELFTRRLHGLDAPAKAALGKALATMSGPALVRSAFELPAGRRKELQDALDETFSSTVPLRFELAPELVAGIELTANGQRLAWSIAAYLASMEKGVGELLDAHAGAEPAPASETRPEPAPKGP